MENGAKRFNLSHMGYFFFEIQESVNWLMSYDPCKVDVTCAFSTTFGCV
jgi:hypothetical protein